MNKIQILSLDVVLGALASGVMAVKVMNSSPGPAWWFVLPGAVWVVYTLDHLADEWDRKQGVLTNQVSYHAKYRLPLLGSALLFSLALLITAWFWLEREVFYFGLVLGAIILIYLLIVHFFGHKRQILIAKKLLISVVYTLGIWGVPIMLANGVNQHQMLILVLFWLMALANTCLFSLFERNSIPLKDAKDKTEIAVRRPAGKFVKLVLVFAVIVIFLSLWYFGTYPLKFLFALLVIALMAFSMYLIQAYPYRFSRPEVYKLALEFVFLLPLLMILT